MTETPSENLNPVVLIPGLAGTRLKIERGTGNVFDLWLHTVNMLKWPEFGISELSANELAEIELQSQQAFVGWDKPEYEISAQGRSFSLPIEPVDGWINAIKLGGDGATPFYNLDSNSHWGAGEIDETAEPDVKARLDAVAFLYPSANSPALKEGSKYFGALIDSLKGAGYKAYDNLIAAPYDWRSHPQGLENRYKYFENLKTEIERLYTSNSKPVVIIAHSLGNRITPYFLERIKETAGQEWIDTHIERYIAVSPPWLGAPMSIRQVIVNEPLMLGPLSIQRTIEFLPTFGGMPWLFPLTEPGNEEEKYKYFNTNSFAVIKQTDGTSLDLGTNIDEILTAGGAESQIQKTHKEKYLNDPNFSGDGEFGSSALKCPPVKKLNVLYSTGVPTQVGAYYKQTAQGIEADKEVNTTENPKLSVINGILVETNQTKQTIDGETKCGDGVVPYGSLVYFKNWQKTKDSRTIIDFTEFPNKASEPTQPPQPGHNTILLDSDVINQIHTLLGIQS